MGEHRREGECQWHGARPYARQILFAQVPLLSGNWLKYSRCSGWSLWSKDIIFLITPDSRAGPQAWVDAYHDEQSSELIEPLPVKSGALQGAVIIDNALDHNFDKIHVVYDGINGQLPNLDLINTAVTIASGQMGIGIALQRMWKHDDKYLERLQTMLRGMLNQGAGRSHGPHSSFIPYHVDAITLQAVGEGMWDDMSLGRVVESIFRSLNNLLEHFHQSFFFYLLMQADRFVSIGTYLPSAMLVAANFSIMAIALWIRSGRAKAPKLASTNIVKGKKPEVEIVEKDGMTSIAPKQSSAILERHLFLPLVFIGTAHFLGLVPMYLFNINQTIKAGVSIDIDPMIADIRQWYLGPPWLSTLVMFSSLNLLIPHQLSKWIKFNTSDQQKTLIQCFSLLILGMILATLATLNFSLSLFVGLLATPLSFIKPARPTSDEANSESSRQRRLLSTAILQLLSPPVILFVVSVVSKASVLEVLAEAAFGWTVNGMWTQVVVWCIWWPAWFVGSVLVWPA